MSDIPKMVGDTLTSVLAEQRAKRKARYDELLEMLKGYTDEISKHTHAGAVMVFAAAVEEQLKAAIMTRMKGISGRQEARLFENYGPLSSFSAKIDVSYALQIITTEVWTDLKVIKEIRNEFAHTAKYINFQTPTVVFVMKKFSSFDPDAPNPERFYFEKVNAILKFLYVIVNRAKAINAPPADETSEPAP